MMSETLDHYQYFVKQNGTVVYRSNIFDAPYAALANFFEYAKEHFKNQKFKRIPTCMNRPVIFENEDKYEIVEGKKLYNELVVEFYQLQYKPMTCTHFADNMLSLNNQKLEEKGK